MHYLNFLYPTLVATSTLFSGAEALRSQKVKLSNVQSLTLRKGQMTSHRRVDPIPQLRCVGGSARNLYEIDIMRCKNEGSDYAEEDIQWACSASLPEEFKLGSTDVICEGYDSPDDPYILKGSCGVEYRLILTEKGEQKYGHKKGWLGDDDEGYRGPKTFGENLANALFWMLFIGVACWMLWSAISGWAAQRGVAGAGGNRPGWGGGGGGGGGWGGGNDDPPPPYDWNPGQNPKQNYGTNQGQQGWRPGFWSGALGGAAAGYAAGRAGNRGNQTGAGWGSRSGSGWGNSGWGQDNDEGSSRGSSSSPSYSSTRYESTGFGSTSRR